MAVTQEEGGAGLGRTRATRRRDARAGGGSWLSPRNAKPNPKPGKGLNAPVDLARSKGREEASRRATGHETMGGNDMYECY